MGNRKPTVTTICREGRGAGIQPTITAAKAVAKLTSTAAEASAKVPGAATHFDEPSNYC